MKRNSEFLIRQVAENYVLSPVGEAAKKFCGIATMNSTGKFIWDLLEQEQTVDAMARTLTENYEVDYERAKESVINFLEPLKSIEAVID